MKAPVEKGLNTNSFGIHDRQTDSGEFIDTFIIQPLRFSERVKVDWPIVKLLKSLHSSEHQKKNVGGWKLTNYKNATEHKYPL